MLIYRNRTSQPPLLGLSIQYSIQCMYKNKWGVKQFISVEPCTDGRVYAIDCARTLIFS